MAEIAKKDAESVLPDVNIKVLDSENVTAAEGFVALAAARAAEEGKGLDECVGAAEDVRAKVQFLAFLDTIRYVYRTGRIPKVASTIGTTLNIKPILTAAGGLVKFVGMVRSKNKASSTGKDDARPDRKREAACFGDARLCPGRCGAPEGAHGFRVRLQRTLDKRVHTRDGLRHRYRYSGGGFLCRLNRDIMLQR
jgi:DegV family protein with EDD domain